MSKETVMFRINKSLNETNEFLKNEFLRLVNFRNSKPDFYKNNETQFEKDFREFKKKLLDYFSNEETSKLKGAEIEVIESINRFLENEFLKITVWDTWEKGFNEYGETFEDKFFYFRIFVLEENKERILNSIVIDGVGKEYN